MARDPYRVFISRVSTEFGLVTTAIASDLRARGIEVKVQEDFTQGHTAESWLERLEEYIRDCHAVICIGGQRSGGFPGDAAIEPYLSLRPPELSRVSYTQWEYFFTIHHRKQLFLYIADLAWTSDKPASTDTDPVSQQAFLDYLRHPADRTSQPFDSAEALRILVLREKWPDYPVSKPSNLPGSYIGQLSLGRDEFLETIRQSLTGAGHATAITQKAAATGISGLGGIGKTHAAVEYANRHRGDYTALLFASGDTPEKLHSSLANLCGVLRLDENGTLSPDEPTRVRAALDWLATHPGWLLIIDNVDDEPAAKAVQEIFGLLTAGHVLITSRLHLWPHQVKRLDISVLTQEVSIALLLELTTNRFLDPEEDTAQARDLALLLDGLPLAIHQAAGFINEENITFSAYISRFQEEAANLLNWFSDLAIPYERPEKLAPCPVLITWKTSFDKLTATDRFWLLVFSHFSPDPIPRFLIERLPDATPENIATLREASGAVTQATKFSLITRFSTEPFFKIHRLVQRITRHYSGENERQRALEQAIDLFFICYSGDPSEVRTWPKWDALQAHAACACDFAPDDPLPKNLARLLGNLALLFVAKARYGEAEAYSRRTLWITRTVCGDNHPEVAICLSNLSETLKDTNRLAEAEPLLRDALRIDRATFGENHPTVASRLNNLAVLLGGMNRLPEAESLIREALRIDLAVYGENHPKVATRLNNLAQLLKATNRMS